MRYHTVFIRFEDGTTKPVQVYAWGENDAVQKVSKKNLGGTIYAVRDQYSTLSLPLPA
jgi:hypothetical protein